MAMLVITSCDGYFCSGNYNNQANMSFSNKISYFDLNPF